MRSEYEATTNHAINCVSLSTGIMGAAMDDMGIDTLDKVDREAQDVLRAVGLEHLQGKCTIMECAASAILTSYLSIRDMNPLCVRNKPIAKSRIGNVPSTSE